MPQVEIQSLGSFVWSIAEILRGDFKQYSAAPVVGAYDSNSADPQVTLRHGAKSSSTYLAASRMNSAPFQPTIMAAALILPATMLGNTEASHTRKPLIPWTRSLASVTHLEGSGPMRQVHDG